jgi:hypothetical protein
MEQQLRQRIETERQQQLPELIQQLKNEFQRVNSRAPVLLRSRRNRQNSGK